MNVHVSSRDPRAARLFVFGVIGGILFSVAYYVLILNFNVPRVSLLFGAIITKIVVGVGLCLAPRWKPLGVGIISSIPIGIMILATVCFGALIVFSH